MLKEEFKDYLKQELNLELSGKQLSDFATYADFLLEYNQKVNLTAITELSDVYDKHFIDSLMILRMVRFKDESLADIGTGAGFPGIPLKIACPDLKLTLIEPTGKRCVFLKETVDRLGLKDVRIIQARAEDLKERECYDYVTARAVASLNILSELCTPLLKVNGKFIVLRGSSGLEEIKQAGSAFKKLHLKQEMIDEFTYLDNQRVNALFVKSKATPSRYPRNYSQIKKDPL
ncbi:MAG: 16S rRNA (guanine(527)-N(7))-methyltransferase RsmG [Erysipelotrichaceae bacterium]|nr:16S rRNA (guanine(527)-N(7))-methyltransferase RsmG [Erysipelotrichaceae bacterium]